MLRNAVAGLVLCAFLAVPAAARDDAAHADAELNAAYQALLAQLGDGDRQRLRDAQRAWIAFRDRECAFRTQGRADSAAAAADCAAELTQQRTEALRRQLDCREGDAGCVARDRRPAAAAAGGAAAAPCSRTLGEAKAAELVERCTQVSPATHPPCNAANACALIVEEIRRSCALLGAEAPAFCRPYAEPR